MTVTATHPAPAAHPRPASRILKNVTSNWAALVVGIVFSFVLAPLTVRSLGNVYYGIWTLLMQFTGYLWLFDFGVRESVIKYVAEYHASDEPDRLVSTVRTAVSMYSVVALAALGAVAILAFALPYLFNIPPDTVLTARLTALLAGATVAQGFVFNVFGGVLAGLQKFYSMARVNIGFSVLRAALVYALLTAGYGVIALALVQFVLTLATNVVIYRMCRSELPYLSIRLVWPERDEAIKLLNYGKYVLISNIGDKVIFATDSIVIGMFLPISALTYYAIGGSLIENMRGFIISMAAIMNPLSSSLEARNESGTVGAVLMAGAKSAMILGVPVCTGFIVLGSRFIGLWMGDEYASQAGLVLAWLSVGHMIGLPYYTISGVLYGLGKHRIVAMSRIFEAALNLGLTLLLIRRFGLVGVAIGTVIPHAIVVALILPAVLPRFMPVSTWDYYVGTYLRPLLASLPFWVWCWFVGSMVRPEHLATFVGSVVIGLPAYVLPCWFIALRPEERAHVTAGVRRRLRPERALAST